MTISSKLEARILRLFEAEKWPVNTIAVEVGVHHSVVQRVIDQRGLPRPQVPRRSKLDRFAPFVEELLRKHPKLCASRIYHMCRERGYVGSESHFRRLVARLRPRPKAEAFLRLRSLPGEQGQVDWGHFGRIQIGQAQRPLLAFVLVLSYSRRIFVRYYLGQQTENFLRGHVAAFGHLSGCPRVLLYDNLKSAVLQRRITATTFNPQLVELSRHYRFDPRPVGVARGNEKGRVERAIQYVRRSFFAARTYTDLDDLNRQALEWCDTIALERPWPEDRSKTVAEAYEEEKSCLLPPPDSEVDVNERKEVSVGKTPYARFDRNDYSVPHDRIRRTLTVIASTHTVRILDGTDEVARHERSYSRNEQIEDPDHVRKLVEAKRKARTQRGFDRLHSAVPSSQVLMDRLAERGANLGAATGRLLRLLDEFGAVAVERAIVVAIDKGVSDPESVRHILDSDAKRQGQQPKIAVELPDDPRVRDLAVEPHDLDTYDSIDAGETHEEVDHD